MKTARSTLIPRRLALLPALLLAWLICFVFAASLLAQTNMVRVAGGSFQMGDSFLEGESNERPVHNVHIRPFLMDKFEVSGELWQEVYLWALTNGYQFDHAGSYASSNHPVHTVSWYDAVKWCNARSEREGFTPCYYTSSSQTVVYRTNQLNLSNSWVNWMTSGYRLPTEAEWEKAARGGLSGKRYPWGDAIDHGNANYSSSGTTPVGSYATNGYGLHDMAGNLWEWCWDWYDSAWYTDAGATQNDTQGPALGTYRAQRGGAWSRPAYDLRCAIRGNAVPAEISSGGYGFRCVRGNLPFIVGHPQSVFALPGSTVSFAVTSEGLTPLTYQWRFNATNLVAETNSTLSISNVQPANVGIYSVVVSNAIGSVASSNAFLTIVTPGVDDDGDGLPNELEVQLGTNPLSPDSDTDSLTDYAELFTHGTNPLLPDTDGDCIPDGWEVQHGLNPRFNDASDDLDGDGVSNLEEYNWSNMHPNQPVDPRNKYSTSATVSDFALVTGTGTNQFFYDRNDRLVGAEYDRGLALAYVYDGNDNLVRQVSMLHDANTNGLPDVWEFLNGLTNNANAFTDTDGDGWSDWQEWKSGTQPTNAASAPNLLGNPGINIASLALPFTPSNFVVGVGQLDGLGAEAIVLGADGNPGTNVNFLLVLTQTFSGWSTKRVDVGAFGITSIAVGQLTNRPSPGIYVGLRGVTNGSGRIVEYTSTGGLWQSNVVALSTDQAAFVLGVRGPDVLVGLATTNAPDGSLSAANFTTNWALSLVDMKTSHRGLGTLFQPKEQSTGTGALRLLDSGGVAVGSTSFSILVANLVSYWKLDESSGNAADSVGANMLTNNNSVTYGSGLINNGANFGNDGSFRSLRRGDALGLTVDQAKTFSFWLKMNNDADSNEEWPLQIGFYTGSDLTSGSVNFSYKGSTHNLYLSKGDNNGHSAKINFTITLGTTSWHHLVGTTDGTTWRFYVDGTLAGTAADYVNNGGNGTFSPAFFTLGASDRPNRFNLDEVGVWSRALSDGEANLLFGNGYGLATRLLPEPFATRTNNWRGTSLASGFLRGTNGSSVFYTFADDKNANGLIDFADDFVTAEYLVNGTNASLLTHSRRPIATLTPAQSYGLASLNFLNTNNEVFFTGEPNGQVFAWTASGTTNPLQRQLFSGHHADKAWHALAGVKTFEPGEGLIGLRVDPASPSNCDVILWSPQSQLPPLASLPNTAPAAAVLPSTNTLGSLALVSVRLWDAEGNASTPFLQYQLSGATNWQNATLVNAGTPVTTSPSGVNHALIWNALPDVGANVVTNILLRARASDITLLGDWSAGTPFQVNTVTGPDADGNGLPDWWEIQYFGGTAVNPDGDPDGDKFLNWQEYLADTNPTNAVSYLHFTSATPLADGLKLDWIGGINATQFLERSFDLSSTNLWSTIHTALPPTPVTGSYTDAPGTNAGRFYRLKAVR